jgi:cyclic beta-1,2-glucan synthetase
VTPVRSTLAGQRLVSQARALARDASGALGRGRRRGLRPDLTRLGRALTYVHRRFFEDRELADAHPRVAEWLLDNEYLTRQALAQVREAIPRGFYRRLPKLGGGPESGPELRVQALARSFASAVGHELDIERLSLFVESFQETRPLTMGELWALPALLRLAVLRELAALTLPLAREDGGTGASDDRVPTSTWADQGVARCIESLRYLDAQDWKRFFERVSVVERVLCEDPAGVYGRMDFETRDGYRKAVESLGGRTGEGEVAVARASVALCRQRDIALDDVRRRHVGCHLIEEGRPALEAMTGRRPERRERVEWWIRAHGRVLYLGSLGGLTALLVTSLLRLVQAVSAPQVGLLVVTGMAGLVPAVSLAVATVNWAVALLVRPRRLPKLDPDEAPLLGAETVVAIPCLLSDHDEVEHLIEKLEVLYQGNGSPGTHFALLSDWTDAPQAVMSGDEHLLRMAREGVTRLNEVYGESGRGTFHLVHRDRRWNDREGCWMGWERKRGKLHQFNRFLLGEEPEGLYVAAGDGERLRGIRYVVTLDADTQVPPGVVAKLVGTLAHPLNQPSFGPEGEVEAGYTVLQPRLETAPTTAQPTLFQRMFEADRGIDLYTHAVSDVYQDLFGEGIYAGKGAYDVEAFERSLAGRVPENALLSHDLFEGLCGRAGLVTDLEFLEEYPSHVLGYARRLHRWIRGDWQLLPWLLPSVPTEAGRRRNSFSLVDRWKILDNLRRSLLTPSLVSLLFVTWLVAPPAAEVWIFLALGVFGFPSLLGAATVTGRLARLRERFRDPDPVAWRTSWQSVVRHGGEAAAIEIGRWILALALLPYESVVAMSAVGVTLWRVMFSRRHLLEWTSAAHTTRRLQRRGRASDVWKGMAASPILAAAIYVIIIIVAPLALLEVLPLVILWVVSPQLAHLVSRPRRGRRERFEERDRLELRDLALRTWSFFQEVVTARDHWLPPDNLREERGEGLARRTSPTNIAMALTGALAAYDLGYVGARELATMVGNTLDTLGRLERHRGHLYNWYDTRDLRPLAPRYVSTVDSGNLAAALLVLRAACAEIWDRPVLRMARLDALLDMLRSLRSAIVDLFGVSDHRAGSARQSSGREAPWQAALSFVSELSERAEATGGDPVAFAAFLRKTRDEDLGELDRRIGQAAQEAAGRKDGATSRALAELRVRLARLHRMIERVVRDTEDMAPAPELLTLPLSELPAALGSGGDADGVGREEGAAAQRLLEEIGSLGSRLDAFLTAMDFSFLFNPLRELFHIGYDVTQGLMDPHFYDLLASEARTASLVAIALGQVPVDHWLRLGRPFAAFRGRPALLSWGGTLFEYLLPMTFHRHPPGTLLTESCRLAVEQQERFGRDRSIPWGLSESGFVQGSDEEYGYRAFGLPALGLRREPEPRVVVTPYASALAVEMAPGRVSENLRRLVDRGMLGRLGMFEALDFGSGPGPGEVVRSYMSHHQGMILTALASFLTDGSMARRFHDDPRVASVEYLLHERVPWQVAVRRGWRAGGPRPRPARMRRPLEAWTAAGPWPYAGVHLLSNGRYRVLITPAGGGSSQWDDLDLTAWEADPTREVHGSAVYLQDLADGGLWSATGQPVDAGAAVEVTLAPHMAEFRTRERELDVWTRVCVAPERDAEIRRVTIINPTDRPRRIAITSYLEPLLASHADARRHPAYARLFVESEAAISSTALLFRRRPRSAAESAAWLAHGVVADAKGVGGVSWETDRMAFLGRRGTPASPAALAEAGPLSNTVGATLDPACALRCEILLGPWAEREVAFVTAAGSSRQEVLEVLGAHRPLSRAIATFERARSSAEEVLARYGIDPRQMELLQAVLSALVRHQPALRPPPERLALNSSGPSALWKFGISGDLPILLVRLGGAEDLGFAEPLIRARACWEELGLDVDLVLLTREAEGYAGPVRERLTPLVEEARSAARGALRTSPHEGRSTGTQRRGDLHLVTAERSSETDRIALESAARVVLEAGSSLAEQVARLGITPDRLPGFIPIPSSPPYEGDTPPLERPRGLRFDNGLGGFDRDGKEYVIQPTVAGAPPPAPWSNVIANPEFGFLTTDSGLGYTWSGDAGENRLTTWRNDPVRDEPAEALYLRDEETGEVWSPTPLPAGGDLSSRVRHGVGYTVFESRGHGLEQSLRLFVPAHGTAKIAELRLRDLQDRPRRVTVTYYAEWVLGADRERTGPHVVASYDPDTEVLLARNSFRERFGERTAFLCASLPVHGFTADRTEFLGQGGLARPDGLGRIGLSGTAEAGLDPCAVLQVHLDVPAGGTAGVHFVLGEGENQRAALDLARRFREEEALPAAWESVGTAWEALLGGVRVRTPEPALDLMLNRWFPYQTISARLWGRTGFHQSSGAYGFRDQLQDVAALIDTAPGLARAHILRAARRQFDEGDVLHWWLPGTHTGVRTRCSDDMLWLPYVVSDYVSRTGDIGVLDESVSYLRADPLSSSEGQRYGSFGPGPALGSLYAHCLRALERGLTRGQHGLPLIGTGDWNDGFDRVGREGRGESVWLAWFLCSTIEAFLPSMEAREPERAARWRGEIAALKERLEEAGWDGDWYRRAYYDDGSPLGSAERAEAKIDALSQAWAVLSGVAEEDRARRAMAAVRDRLMHPGARLLQLLTPPFDRSDQDPGYIKAYPPGIRENGGQYSHAAVWVAWAFAELDDPDTAVEILRWLNPVLRSADSEAAARYRAEPYVMAADVYAAAPHEGRGGWTWYTGSAAWARRLGVEAVLGLRLEGGGLRVRPRLPPGWARFEVDWRLADGSRFQIRVRRAPGHRGRPGITVDGTPLEGEVVPLVQDGGTHRVDVRIEAAGEPG